MSNTQPHNAKNRVRVVDEEICFDDAIPAFGEYLSRIKDNEKHMVSYFGDYWNCDLCIYKVTENQWVIVDEFGCAQNRVDMLIKKMRWSKFDAYQRVVQDLFSRVFIDSIHRTPSHIYETRSEAFQVAREVISNSCRCNIEAVEIMQKR